MARRMKRKVIVHMGPTNSGKTFSALNRLAEAKTGIYCGPLRLLAHEVHEKLNSKDVPCNLLTGQMRMDIPGAKHVACTVEMADLNQTYDCAVIDEIQMIGSSDRGWAWTRALLGILAHEIHLCGDDSALPVIKRLIEQTGDELDVKTYQRLSPLIPHQKEFKRPFENLQKGDCVIAFSRKEIYRLKSKIEKRTGKRCCVIYGALSPEVRKQQASLFNDPYSEYDILVASDAIGMGLNLNIRRVIFSSLVKFDGTDFRLLTPLEIRQIAGRAGRFGTAFPNGEVAWYGTPLHSILTASSVRKRDVEVMIDALKLRQIPLPSAGVFPNYEHVEMFARCIKHKKLRFSKIIDRFIAMISVDKNYFLCDHSTMLELSQLIDHIDLTLKDRYTFVQSPVDTRNATLMAYLLAYATKYASGNEVPLGITLNPSKYDNPKELLKELESLHQVCDLYLWLSLRFEEFNQVVLATKAKRKISSLIEMALAELDESHHGRLRQRKQLYSKQYRDNTNEEHVEEDEDDEDDFFNDDDMEEEEADGDDRQKYRFRSRSNKFRGSPKMIHRALEKIKFPKHNKNNNKRNNFNAQHRRFRVTSYV